LAVGLVLSSVIVSYTKLQSNVDEVVKDSTEIKVETKRLETCKVDKLTFTEYKDQQEKAFDEFKANQKVIQENITEIKVSNADIKAKLELILKAVNNK